MSHALGWRREAVQHSSICMQADDSTAPTWRPHSQQHTLHHQLCAGLSHRSAQEERCHALHPRLHPPNLTEADVWSHANLPVPALPKVLSIWSLWQISLETNKRPLPHFALQTDFTRESTERILQIVMTKRGRFHSSFIKFALADYFLQMTKASSLNLIRATFNTATEVHKFNLNQGWVFSANCFQCYCNENKINILPSLSSASVNGYTLL